MTTIRERTQESEDFLAHYGVKGMKWGVRKDRPGVIGRMKKTKDEKDEKDEKPAEKPPRQPGNSLDGIRGTKVDVTKMTDKDLRELVNRINTEREYSKLTAAEKSRAEKIIDEVSTMTMNAVKKQSQNVINDLIAERLTTEAVKKLTKTGPKVKKG